MLQGTIKTHMNKVVGIADAFSNINATISSNYSSLQNSVSNEATARAGADTTLTNSLNDHITNSFTPLAATVATINGSATTPGSFTKAIADAIALLEGGAGVQWDTLNTIQQYLTNNPTAGDVVARLMAVEAGYQAADTTETNARIAADNALAALIAALTTAVNAASVTPMLENVSVSGSSIVLSQQPRLGTVTGISAISNFGRVSYFDSVTGATYEAAVVMDTTDSSGKTFIVQTDVAGEWDGFFVTVQYTY